MTLLRNLTYLPKYCEGNAKIPQWRNCKTCKWATFNQCTL